MPVSVQVLLDSLVCDVPFHFILWHNSAPELRKYKMITQFFMVIVLAASKMLWILTWAQPFRDFRTNVFQTIRNHF